MARFGHLLDLAHDVLMWQEVLERDFIAFKGTHHTNESIVGAHNSYHTEMAHGWGNGLIACAMATLLPNTREIVSNTNKTGKRVEAWLNHRLDDENTATSEEVRAALNAFVVFMKEFDMIRNTAPIFVHNWWYILSYDRFLSYMEEAMECEFRADANIEVPRAEGNYRDWR